MNADTLQPLLDRLEKATGPDRELDAMIAAAVEPHLFDSPGFPTERPIPPFRYDRNENAIRFEGGGIMDMRFFFHVTASVDAAIALAARVLPGCDICTQDIHADFRQADEPRHMAEVMTELQWTTYDGLPEPNYTVSGAGQSNFRAIAICIAVLRALQSQEPHP